MGEKYLYKPIPENLREYVKKERLNLVESIIEYDEECIEKFFNGKDIKIEKLRELIRKGVIEGKFIPVFCGSAFKNKGIQTLIDAVIDYLPSPMDKKYIKTDVLKDKKKISVLDKNLCALAFKIMNDPFVGSITFVRIYSGEIKVGQMILNSTRNKKEKIGRIMMMHANNREEIKKCKSGDIVAISGLKNTFTGDTLCNFEKKNNIGKNKCSQSSYRSSN